VNTKKGIPNMGGGEKNRFLELLGYGEMLKRSLRSALSRL